MKPLSSSLILTCKATVDMSAILQAKEPDEVLRWALKDLYRKIGDALASRKDLLTALERKDAFLMEYEFRAAILGEAEWRYVKDLEAEVIELRDQVDFLLGVKK